MTIHARKRSLPEFDDSEDSDVSSSSEENSDDSEDLVEETSEEEESDSSAEGSEEDEHLSVVTLGGDPRLVIETRGAMDDAAKAHIFIKTIEYFSQLTHHSMVLDAFVSLISGNIVIYTSERTDSVTVLDDEPDRLSDLLLVYRDVLEKNTYRSSEYADEIVDFAAEWNEGD